MPTWVKGVLWSAGFGAIGAVVGGLSLIIQGQVCDWRLMGVTALGGALTGLWGYMKQSPLPPPDDKKLPGP